MSVACRVEAEAQRSLELLRIIEKTVESVVGISKVFEGIADGDEKAELDPDGKNVEAFAAGQAVCASLLTRFERCVASARVDARLRNDDGVASGPASEPSTSADDLIAFLRR